MKNKVLNEILSTLGVAYPGQNLIKKYANEKPPIRSEILSSDQMKQFAGSLAKTHHLLEGKKSEHLLKRLSDNEDLLIEVQQLLTESLKEGQRISPAGEWLLDNFYLIEEQIKTGKLHLPKGYSSGLPQLSKGPSAGFPRVYDIALGIISHSDGRVDQLGLANYIRAYQSVNHLQLGELWAVPIMLRIALIENLRRLAAQIAISRIYKNMADYWADEMTHAAENDPKRLIMVIADMAKSGPPLESSFVAEFYRKLQGKGASLALTLTWIEQRLTEIGITAEDLIQAENQKQAADQVSISNSIASLRFLGTSDWRIFVENASFVEQTLKNDPAGIYGKMDFRTRDHYRHVIETISKNSHLPELKVAEAVVSLASNCQKDTADFDRKSHIGYYLINKGRPQLEAILKVRLPIVSAMRNVLREHALFIYISVITIFSVLYTWIIYNKVHEDGLHGWQLSLLIIVAVLCASQLAIILVNWFASLFVPPDNLPRMDFQKGIPPEFKTMVVVPTLLTNPADLEKLTEGLEVKYLANRDPSLLFALLTDFMDAPYESTAQDNEILAMAISKINGLNSKYAGEGTTIFCLFNRPRKWNASENAWMGYERKRGKLSALNALLLNKPDAAAAFNSIIWDKNNDTTVKYILTLDTDTQLPRETAFKIIATMAHPLNMPVYNEEKKRVTEGYTILQPRISVSIPDENSSLFAQLHTNDHLIDPYTRTTSDVYQDLFKEGSFIGKGIYEIEMFEKVLADRFMENRILSHDLLEGCYTRSALISDVQLYEKYPTNYLSDQARRHRWIRGDWQIFGWLLPIIFSTNRKIIANPISALSKWKIFDNIRRSLVPLAMVTLLIMGWTVLQNSWVWSLTIIAIVGLPSLINFIWEVLLRKPEGFNIRQHFFICLSSIKIPLVQNAFILICLPFEAFVNANAILKTLWRLFISKKKLLEWNPGSSKPSGSNKGWSHFYRKGWLAILISIIIIGFLLTEKSISLLFASPFLIAWLLSPLIMWRMSNLMEDKPATLTREQQIYLRKISRKTWNFFEVFVNENDHWLPPDNYQEHPVERIAHRTSPTNMGLSLLSSLAAYDFGYLNTDQLTQRLSAGLKSMQGLEKYKGHFLNWYDTQTLQSLTPKYVSTVDSGNLSGHLLTLSQGLQQIPENNIIDIRFFRSIEDSLFVLEEYLVNSEVLNAIKREIFSCTQDAFTSLDSYRLSIQQLTKRCAELQSTVSKTEGTKAQQWTALLCSQCNNAYTALTFMAPWLLLENLPAKYNKMHICIGIPSINELTKAESRLIPSLTEFFYSIDKDDALSLNTIIGQVKIAEERAISKNELIQQLAKQCEQLAKTEYDFLYDKEQNLLSIGFHVDELRRDIGFYDLLASEARLGIFVAIAQGSIPQDSWFALGRQLTNTAIAPILLSWSGSMFEYLMPLLVMPTYKNTLLDQTYKASIKKQIEYGKQRNVCWGVSESGYYMFDAALNYQYRAFGVPGLGLKRGLGEDLVIAPYASVMALMVDPVAACSNMEGLSAKGYEADYGFYEAIDYSPARLARGKSAAIIRSFMVHHQGMSLLSLNHLLLNRPMQKRFEALPQFNATLLLLQERIPAAGPSYNIHTERTDSFVVEGHPELSIINTPHTAIPELQLLSNGRYHVMVSNSGGGYSKWNNLSVTRWREDGTCDNWGNFCYVHDLENQQYWSTAHQPTLKKAKSYEVVFSQGRAEFRRRDGEIETYTEIIVSPEDDIEIRRVHLTNYSKKQKILEITSYAEVVIATEAADSLHPAFSELFVETSILRPRNAILCTRRPRSIGEMPPYMFHVMKVHGAAVKEISFETDRMKFIGRGNSRINPAAVENTGALSNSEGPVLYPVIAIKYRIAIEPQQTVIADLIVGIHETKEGALQLIERYNDRAMANRAFELSWTHSLVTLQQINATEADAQLYGKLASSVIYINPALRADAKILLQNQSGQSGLWSYSISGDVPIVLLRLTDPENLELVKQMLQAHAYWRLKGLLVDLVIWNEDRSVYRQQLQNLIIGLISPSISVDMRERPGGIFIRNSEQISNEDRILFQTVSRVIISDSAGSLDEQVNKRAKTKLLPPAFITQKTPEHYTNITPATEALQFNNGLGGYSSDGKEYIIKTDKNKLTALPWCNVIANPGFGTVISESGQAYTWAENAHEYRLTPWNNDPVSDSSGEAFYIRDEETGLFWSPMALPAKGNGPYTCRHGFGYSIFDHCEEGISSTVSVFVDIADPVKMVVVKIKNLSERSRTISVTGYMDWVLGDLKTKSNMHIVTELDKTSNALFVSNPYNRAFPNRVVFFDADGLSQSYTTDRNEFIGRNASLFNPAAMGRIKLSGKTGAGLDACASIQNYVALHGFQEQEIIFLTGAAKDKNEAQQLIEKYSTKKAAIESLERVKNYWHTTLNAVKIKTPDEALNSISNGWLNYQTLASRLWGRSGYYQSGGAFGFRDQLQDVLSLLHSRPEMVRAQILLHASRQFMEGDVQHWWHPPQGRGVRTRCSDDYLWLPYVLNKYLTHTDDYEILNEMAYYLDGRLLNENEESYYDLPQRSSNKGSIYEHCCKAITHGLRMGVHGLPLMGSGDWNDGMDQVGIHGRGESVWLAHFLYDVLIKFSIIALKQKDNQFSALCIEEAHKLQSNIEKNAWDGNWYKRAFFDDGTALGSNTNEECSIDAIAQSWSVLSNSGSPERIKTAMESAYTQLVKKDISLIQLLQPAFDKSGLNPGYIKGYVPGVRENGGQYTHAAIWMIMAFAKLHNTEKTWELLEMINPINHALNPESVQRYKAEPYVIAADVYASPSHMGRGGWTWYTGSASWMYQLILESVLGLNRMGNTLSFKPCIPKSWNSFSIAYQFQQSLYQITVIQNEETVQNKLILDGVPQGENALNLVNDQQTHNVIIYC